MRFGDMRRKAKRGMGGNLAAAIISGIILGIFFIALYIEEE